MKRVLRPWYVGLLLFVLVVSALAPNAFLLGSVTNTGADHDGTSTEETDQFVDDIPYADDIDNKVKSINSENLYKVDSSLAERIGKKGYAKVFVATTNVPELAATLDGYQYSGLIGTGAEQSDNIVVPLLVVPLDAILDIASLPEVIAIFEYSAPEKHFVEPIKGLDWNTQQPLNLNSTVNHRANKAWEKNFTGDGINIAVIDDGVDFSHPDLMGTQARVDKIHYVQGAVVVMNATAGQTEAQIATPYSTYIVPNSYKIYKDSIEMSESIEYTLNLSTRNITFTPALSVGNKITADYAHYSPYYNWPIAFDPFSMSKYLSTGDASDSWYSATNTTNENVSHTIKMDGTNDFWDDGTELVATDTRGDVNVGLLPHLGNDFDLTSLYVTQDEDFWYIGLVSLANQTNMTFGIYINTTIGGPEDDPLGNYLNASADHRPEIAIYVGHKGLQKNWNDNDTIDNATIHKWDAATSTWGDEKDLHSPEVGGAQSYSGWKPERLEGFLELKVPKLYIEDDGNISIIAFTTNYTTPSQPQDTVYSDTAVDLGGGFPDLMSTSIKTVSAFTIVGRGFWRHTYTRPGDTILGVLNTNKSWPIVYTLTNTSKSGVYYFGDLPDENYPQTRVLVVDEAVAGTYDTVYVDMDHNKDFNNDKPNKRLGIYDDQMFWHDLNWTGTGTLYDELVYADWFDAEIGITSLDYSPNGSYLVSGGNDHKVILWRTSDWSIYNVLNAHMGRVTDVEFSPDGKFIASSYEDASGSGDQNVVIWNFTSGLINNTFVGHTEKVTAVAWSPSGTEVASSSLDGTLKLWNVTTNQLVKTFDTVEPAVAMDWSSQDRIAVGVDNKTLFWNSTDAPITPPMEVNMKYEVASLAFNPNGSWLAVGEHLDLVAMIDVATGNVDETWGLAKHFGGATVKSVSWSPDGNYFFSTPEFTTDTVTNFIVEWQILDYNDFFNIASKTVSNPDAHVGDVVASVFSPSGTEIATGSRDTHIKMWTNTTLVKIQDLFDPEKAHTLGSEDKTRYDTGDSLPDVSGGMIYHIATSDIPLPYSETYTKRLVGVEKNKIPDNGQMVAFMGAMDNQQGHGTLVTSAIVGQGKTLYFDTNTNTHVDVPNVVGFAPNAKIIAIANIYMSNFFDGWYFAVEGLDGELNTGDEAVIASNSYGFSSIYPDGWNFYDRFVDWISMLYSKGRTTFVFSAGNSGYGYGTVSTPGSSTGVITAGASTDFGYRPQAGWEAGPSPTYGDMVTYSSRGPTAMGKPDPDVVANGRMSFGSTPLNQVTYAPLYNGTRATDIWAGTSLSAPSVAGVLALVYEAYYKAEHLTINETLTDFRPVGGNNVTELKHAPISPNSYNIYKNGTLLPPANYSLYLNNGTFILLGEMSTGEELTATYKFYDDYPDAETARSIIMSSADDINFDVLSQGAGFVNTERAVNIANNISGITVSPNTWTPGEFKGEKYEASISFMDPKTYENTTFTVKNSDPVQGVTLNISDSVFKKMGEINYTIMTTENLNGEPQPHWSFIFTNNIGEQSLPSPGVYNLTNLSQGIKYKVADINETMWLNTELLKITASANQSFLDTNLDGNQEHNYWLDVYDWTFVCPPCDIDPDLILTGSRDLNRINMDNPTSNVLQVMVHNPAQRIHDALGWAIRPVLKGERDIVFKVTLEFYNKTDWNWLEVDSQLVLDTASTPDGIKTFYANLSVPDNTPIGSYQGAIYIDSNIAHSNETTWGRDDYPNEYIKLMHDNVVTDPVYLLKVYRNSTMLVDGINYTYYPKTGIIKLFQNVTAVTSITVDYWYYNVTTIPILVNVPADVIDFAFGDNAPGQDELFINRIQGGFGNGGKSGDWRFYYVDLPDQGLFAGENMKFFLNISWEWNLTDIDAFSFGEGGRNLAGVQYPQSRYGPVLLMEEKGGSEETSAFYTTTNSNREIVMPPLTGGFNVIAIHNVKMNGTVPSESFHGEVGFAEVVPSEFKIVTKDLAGSRNVTLYSSRELYGIDGVAAGPSAPERIVNITIKQDDISGTDFIEMLSKGSYTKPIKVQKSALILGANITSLKEYVEKPCRDLDLGLFLDGLGPDNTPDGEAHPDEFIAYDADQDAEERIKIIKPTVEDDPDTIGIDEAKVGAPYLIKVLGYDTGGQCLFNMDVNLVQGEGFTVEGASDEVIPPFNVTSVGVSWKLDASTSDGEFMGAFYVGPYNAPMALLVSIELIVETVPPEIFNFEITTSKGVWYLDNRTTNDNQPTITAYLSDSTRGELDWRSAKIYLDGEDITSEAEVDIPYEDPDGRAGSLEYGYWNGVMTYTPAHALADGTYTVRYEVKDIAGNMAIEEYLLIIDTIAPSLDDSKLSPGYGHATPQSSVVVEGATDPFATVTIRGTNLTADDTGSFDMELDLAPGINDISITVVDWFDKDLAGNIAPGNSNTKTLRIIRDELAPEIFSVSNTTGTPTNEDFSVIRGFVSDTIGTALLEYPWDPQSVELTINGFRTTVLADGSFTIALELNEGLNNISFEAVDAAGNSALYYGTIMKDNTRPSLSIMELPSQVSTQVIVIEGVAETGTTVLVNGQYVTSLGGSFAFEVTLNEGLNTITVEAIDEAGNTETKTLNIGYAPEEPAPYFAIPLFIILFIIVFFIGLQIGRKKQPEEEPAEYGAWEMPPPPDEEAAIPDEPVDQKASEVESEKEAET